MSLNIFLNVDGKNINLYQTETSFTNMLFQHINSPKKEISDEAQVKLTLNFYFDYFKSKLQSRNDRIEFNKHKVEILNKINNGKKILLYAS